MEGAREGGREGLASRKSSAAGIARNMGVPCT